MSETEYIHGFTDEEQQRLVQQAEYWRKTLIPHGLSYAPGADVLEMGCAAGAALGVLATEFPGIRVAGVDLEPRQIAFAREHLASLGVEDGDLRVGDAAALPWPDESFDHVFVMWVVEHLADAGPFLAEAHRVLRPGGTIAVTETDYTTFKVLPSSPDWDALERAQHDFFARIGTADIGRMLGPLLVQAGFEDVRNAPCGYHFFAGDGSDGLRAHVDYVHAFLGPCIPGFVRTLGADESALRRGLDHLASVPDDPRGSMTQIVYRAHGRKAGGSTT